MILRSPLDPRIPIESLEHMPDDGSILVLKHFYNDICMDAIRRLYTLVPELNDRAVPCSSSPDLSKDQKSQDGGTDIIRT